MKTLTGRASTLAAWLRKRPHSSDTASIRGNADAGPARHCANAMNDGRGTGAATGGRENGSRRRTEGPLEANARAIDVETDSSRKLEDEKRLRWEFNLRQETEAKLRERELELRTIFDTAADGLIVIDEQSRIERINRATQDMFGYSADALIGSDVKMLVPEPDRHEPQDFIKRHVDTREPKVIGKHRELHGLRSDGTEFPLEITVSDLWIGGRHLYAGFLRDITLRKEVENLKNEFISTVSHELRTPLTSIRGSLGLLRGNVVGGLDDKAQKVVDIAYRNSERLVRLIDDILDIEKIEAGKLALDPRPIEVAGLLEEAVSANAAYAAQCQVSLELDCELPCLTIDGDRGRLLQVFCNLISNASKFSPQDSIVTVTAARVSDRARISVIDRGPGIPEKFCDTIFGRFAQADGSDSRMQGGSGLGLNISKQIVELHGGSIGYDTEVGKGTTFYFELPIGQAQRDCGEDEAEFREGADRRVLVCESDRTTARMLAEAMARRGFVVDTAPSDDEAQKSLVRNRYAAVVLDPGRWDIDCAEFAGELRRTVNTAGVPLIVLAFAPTGDTGTPRGGACSLFDWLEKPADGASLYRAIGRLTDRSANCKLRILQADDDAELNQSIVAAVGDLGEVIAANTATEAQRLLSERAFDAIVLDPARPDGLGKLLLSRLGRTINRATPVLLTCAEGRYGETRSSLTGALAAVDAQVDDLVELASAMIESTLASDEPPHAQSASNTGKPQ